LQASTGAAADVAALTAAREEGQPSDAAASPAVTDVSITSQLRVLVAPTRVCQLVTPTLEKRCAALGQDGKDNDAVCKGVEQQPCGHPTCPAQFLYAAANAVMTL
jgi:hypothetical protein